MSKQDEIRAAEKAVVDEARRVIELMHMPHRALKEKLAKLDALQSPLPSREEMRARWAHHSNDRGGLNDYEEHMAERHWADCLRWVATEMRVSHQPGALYSMMPGSPTYQDAFEGAQKQLRAWADELEERGGSHDE